VVLDCSDNFATRHAINRACVHAGVPLVSGAAIRFDGQLSVFDPRHAESPCYHCIFPQTDSLEEVRCAVMGVFAPLTGMVGTMQAAEALKILGGVTFQSLQSSYSVVHQLTDGIVSVVGDSSQGLQGRILAVIRVRLNAAVSGVGLVAQVVPGSFQFTLANAVPYAMLVRTAGFSCRSDQSLRIPFQRRSTHCLRHIGTYHRAVTIASGEPA
jgi:hypothetical protein